MVHATSLATDAHSITIPTSLLTFVANSVLHKSKRVYALLHRNEFLANILVSHTDVGLITPEIEFIKSCIDCGFWPVSFSH